MIHKNLFPCGFGQNRARPTSTLYLKGRSFTTSERFSRPKTSSCSPYSSLDTQFGLLLPSKSSTSSPEPQHTSPFRQQDTIKPDLARTQISFLRDYHHDSDLICSDDPDLLLCHQILNTLRDRESECLLLKIQEEQKMVSDPPKNWFCLKTSDFLTQQRRYRSVVRYKSEIEQYRNILSTRASTLS
ncbi:hypothetical protein RCL1_000640 [Eukaryota sp. TZLM3-RCL]